MLSILRLAIRNIWRGKARTILVVLILGVVLGLGLVMQGVSSNIESNVAQIRQTLGNIVMVFPPGSTGMPGFGGGGTLDEAIMEEVKGLQHVEEVAGRVIGQPESTSLETPSFGGGGLGMTPGGGMRPGMGGGLSGPLIFVNGIAVGQPLSTPQGGEAEIISGRNLAEGDEAQNVALVGEKLAMENNLGLGSRFDLNEEEFTVIGVITTGTMFDNFGLFIPVASAQRVLEQEGGVNAIVVKVDSFDNVESTLVAMQDLLGERADVVSPLTMVTRFIGSTLAGITSTMKTGANVTLVVAGIVVLFTMVLVVRESTREIGTLKAIGASNSQVLLQFTTQALVLTLIGAFLGIGVYLFSSQAIPELLGSNGLGRLFGVEVSLTVGMGYVSWAVLSAIVGGEGNVEAKVAALCPVLK